MSGVKSFLTFNLLKFQVTRELERGSQDARYYQEVIAPRQLANFRPFNFDEWWGRRKLQSINRQNHRSSQGFRQGLKPHRQDSEPNRRDLLSMSWQLHLSSETPNAITGSQVFYLSNSVNKHVGLTTTYTYHLQRSWFFYLIRW